MLAATWRVLRGGRVPPRRPARPADGARRLGVGPRGRARRRADGTPLGPLLRTADRRAAKVAAPGRRDDVGGAVGRAVRPRARPHGSDEPAAVVARDAPRRLRPDAPVPRLARADHPAPVRPRRERSRHRRQVLRLRPGDAADWSPALLDAWEIDARLLPEMRAVRDAPAGVDRPGRRRRPVAARRRRGRHRRVRHVVRCARLGRRRARRDRPRGRLLGVARRADRRTAAGARRDRRPARRRPARRAERPRRVRAEPERHRRGRPHPRADVALDHRADRAAGGERPGAEPGARDPAPVARPREGAPPRAGSASRPPRPTSPRR